MAISKQSLFSKKEFAAQLAKTESPIAVFKTAIKDTREQLKKQYLSKASASDLVEALTWFMDEILSNAWQLHKHKIPPKQKIALDQHQNQRSTKTNSFFWLQANKVSSLRLPAESRQ